MTPSQLSVVHEVASKYWQEEADRLDDALTGITIINEALYKIVGFLPEYKEFPAVLFKIYFNESAYQNEVNGYRLANTIEPIGNIYIPKITKLFPEHSALLIERIPMQDTLPEIRRLFYKKPKVDWKQLGNWLRAFHDTEPLAKDNQRFIEYLHNRMDQHLKQIGYLFQPDQVEAIKYLSLSAKDYVNQNTLEWVNMHGDFNMDSIKISKSATYIIDFERLTVAPRGYEVISFLAALQFSINFLYRKAFFQWFSNEFLEGYGIQIESNPLNNFFYLKTIFDLISHYQRRKSASGFSINKFGYHFLEKEMIKATCQFLNKPCNS